MSGKRAGRDKNSYHQPARPDGPLETAWERGVSAPTAGKEALGFTLRAGWSILWNLLAPPLCPSSQDPCPGDFGFGHREMESRLCSLLLEAIAAPLGFLVQFVSPLCLLPGGRGWPSLHSCFGGEDAPQYVELFSSL